MAAVLHRMPSHMMTQLLLLSSFLQGCLGHMLSLHIYIMYMHILAQTCICMHPYILYNKYVPRSMYIHYLSIFTYKTTPPLPRPPLIKSVIGERELDASVRWMAITFIKNGVERYWRPGAPK